MKASRKPSMRKGMNSGSMRKKLSAPKKRGTSQRMARGKMTFSGMKKV